MDDVTSARFLRKLGRERSVLSERVHSNLTAIEAVSRTFDVVPGASYQFVIESVASDEESAGAALLQIVVRDSKGNQKSVPGWGYVSPRVGEYVYLSSNFERGVARTEFSLKVPSEGATVTLIGHRWKRKIITKILQDVVFIDETRTNPTQLPSGAIHPISASKYCETLDVAHGVSSLVARLGVCGGKKSGKYPFALEYYDAAGTMLLPSGDIAQHPKFGAILLIDSVAGKNAIVDLNVPVPSDAALVTIRGVDWNDITPKVTTSLQVEGTSTQQDAIGEFLMSVDDSDRLYVVDTTAPPVGHDTLSLRPNNLSLAWARQGTKVIFLPFSTIQDKPMRPAENILQINRADFGELRNWLIENRYGRQNVYICSSFPDADSVASVDLFKMAGWRTVYECRDDMEEFNRVGYSKWYSPHLERHVIENVDCVTAVSDSLASKLGSMTTRGCYVHTTPNGVSRTLIEEASWLRSRQALSARQGSKTFGYVGHLTDAWFDWQLVLAGAKARPEYNFEIVGHGMPDWVALPSNVKFLGPKSHSELLDIVVGWRAGLIPFADSPLTRSVDPNKLYEYFAWGLSCISAPMGAVHHYAETQVYESLGAYIDALDYYAKTDLNEDSLVVINSILEECSWDARAATCVDIFDGNVQNV